MKRLRRRPLKIIINTRTFKVTFENQVRKKLSILEFINIYNYYINEIDNVD